MNIQRLRNLTTLRLHTEIGHVYEDIEYITGDKGIMTHMLLRASEAMEPYLRKVVTDSRFWDGKFDTTHVGDFEIAPMDDQEKAAFIERYLALPNPLDGKKVVAVVV